MKIDYSEHTWLYRHVPRVYRELVSEIHQLWYSLYWEAKSESFLRSVERLPQEELSDSIQESDLVNFWQTETRRPAPLYLPAEGSVTSVMQGITLALFPLETKE